MLSYAAAADLAAHLKQARFQDSLLLTAPGAPAGLAQFVGIELIVALPGQQVALAAEVLQLMPGDSLVLRLPDAAALDALLSRSGLTGAATAAPSVTWQAATVPAPVTTDPAPTAVDPVAVATAPAPIEPSPRPQVGAATPATEESREHRGPVIPAGMGPMSWPIEKLQSDWEKLSIADKVNVAKHGGLAARRMILKMQDRQLHQYVLANPALTADEVAAMAGMAGLAPELLKQIANKPEWTRHAAVVRNLICHPKLPQDLVARMVGLLPDLELRRLAKTGRVRESVKRLIIRKVEQ